MPLTDVKFEIKTRPRVLKYAEGKDPEKDEPDEIWEGEERTWTGKQAREIVDRLGRGYDMEVLPDGRVAFLKRADPKSPGQVLIRTKPWVKSVPIDEKPSTEEDN